ncbi:hypothetical protein ACHAXT_011254 [Thalassiosira profunda]
MDGTSAAAAAQCHYQAGRYARAAAEFERGEEINGGRWHKIIVPLECEAQNEVAEEGGEDDIIMADDGPDRPPKRRPAELGRVELIALPQLARSADLAMCRLRSAVASGGGSTRSSQNEGSASPKSTATLWKEALEANETYRRSLKGAALSLVESCNAELHIMEQHSHLVSGREKDHTSIERAMKSTALALLMAGVAASHLHLHNVEATTQRGGGNCNEAWDVLADAAASAADLVRFRAEWLGKMNGNASDSIKTGGGKSSVLEGSLCILNETLCSDRTSTEERERGSVAMHSFRSALKAAALATGKLILPKQQDAVYENENGGKQPSKRQKVKKEGEGVSKEVDAWNVSYVHSSPVLHSRDRLVDALSFHSASIRYPNRRESLIGKRNACFEEAVKWETRAGTLYDVDGVETDGCAGYAWKVRNCLIGMALASGPFNESKSEEQKKTLQSLELLASTSTSQYACDLLGCIYAQRGEFSRAHEKFQLSLEQGETGSDGDQEMSDGLAQRRTVMNMALCFLAMGEVNTPLELLLHVWMTSAEPRPSGSDAVRPTALLLSASSSEVEGTIKPTSGKMDDDTKMQLLWKLFHASSLAQDWGTCLNTLEEMPTAGGCAPGLQVSTLEIPRGLTGSESTSRAAVALLYHADASLLDEQSRDGSGEEGTTLDCTKRALATIETAVVGRGYDEAQQDLFVAAYNNHGVASLTVGDSVEALRCFREAARHASSAGNSDAALPWLLLPTYFNLSLLLLRDGHLEESAKSWLLARGHFSTWQKAIRGDNQALRQLKDLRVVAFNRHGLLMAKRSMQGDATALEQEVISEWVPPNAEDDVSEESTRVGGVDASQITAMDVVLLRHAVSIAEKKASSSFRRTAGHIGHH